MSVFYKPSPKRRATTEPPRHVDSPVAELARTLVKAALADMLDEAPWDDEFARPNIVRLIAHIFERNAYSFNFPRGWCREVMIELKRRGQPTTAASVRWYRSALSSGEINSRGISGIPKEIVDRLEEISLF